MFNIEGSTTYKTHRRTPSSSSTLTYSPRDDDDGMVRCLTNILLPVYVKMKEQKCLERLFRTGCDLCADLSISLPSLPLVLLGGPIRPSRSALSILSPTCLCALPSLCTRRRKTRCDAQHNVYNRNTFLGFDI